MGRAFLALPRRLLNYVEDQLERHQTTVVKLRAWSLTPSAGPSITSLIGATSRSRCNTNWLL